MSIFCKVGISGFVGGIVLSMSLVSFQILGLAINDRVSDIHMIHIVLVS